MIAIDPAMYPRRDQLELLSEFAPGNPVWMVSMQRYRDTAEYAEAGHAGSTGREAYARYADVLRPVAEKHGARVVAVADMRGLLIGTGSADFHTMTILEFPDVDTWQAVMEMDEVKESSHHRVAGLESQVLLLASPRDGI